jgi:hypothetical protein
MIDYQQVVLIPSFGGVREGFYGLIAIDCSRTIAMGGGIRLIIN